MGLWNFQTNFTRGELDPRLVGRIDIQSYYSGVKKAENVLCIPQGGIKRRPGTEFIGEALGEGRLEKFSFRVGLEYLLVFTNQKLQIYKNGVLQTNLNGSGLDYIDTPYTTGIKDFDYIQAADVAIIVHPDYEPQQITRTSDTNWSIAPISFKQIPQFDFNDASSPSPTDEVQQILFTNVTEGDRYRIGLEGVLTDDIIYSSDDTENANLIQQELLALINTGNDGITVINDATDRYQITFSGNSAKDWDLATVTPVLTKETTFQATSGRITAGSSRKEDVWSATRGWPRTATFHESRLWFGGSRDRPTTIWGSNVNDFFLFDAGRGRDDESIAVTLNTDQLNEIQAIFSNRSLQIFTSGQEFYVKQSPVTPGNISVLPQTNMGSRRVRPVAIEGVTLYVQRNRRSVNQFVFLDAVNANQSVSATTLAPHLITDPRKLVIKQGDNNTDANYVYIHNFNEGNITVLNTLLSEDVQAFTQWKTGIETSLGISGVIDITVVDDKLHLLVLRNINGSTVYQIEKESITANTDAAVLGSTNDGIITGLEHLEGETVQVKADNSYIGEFVVAGGQVDIERAANSTEVGLGYTPLVETMPLNIGLQDGPNAASKKRIKRVAVNFFESNGILVNNQRIADKTIGQNQFDPPAPQTGFKRIHLLGWSVEASVTITQTTPFDMTVLSLGLEVAT